MRLIEELDALGANTKEGMDRVMGDSSLYKMMLGMFLDTLQDTPVKPEEFASGDLEPLIRKIHLLKGTTGNLSLTPLFTGYTQTLKLLREGDPVQARAEWEALLPVQEKMVRCIQRHRAE